MIHPGIYISGNIVSGEILDKIRNEDTRHQAAADFGLDKKTSVRDEIGLAWAATRAHWTAFRLRLERLKEGDSGASETRNSWMLPLLRELGYNTEKATAWVHPDTQKVYAISHRAENLNGFPIHIMGWNDSLDQRREAGGPRLSPHSLVQEYLNHTGHTYALVTNGQKLRLLRDATRLVRLSYLEFDLQKIMEEELYADFAVLFRILHATRMPKQAEEAESSFIEYYHQESLASGSRIRGKLSEAVEESIQMLGNGFLSHPDNQELIQRIKSSSLPPNDYYLHLLRLIYRFLFLIVTEERNLVYPDTRDEKLQKMRSIYYDYYSIARLRRLALKMEMVEGRRDDLWEGMKATFRLFENGFFAARLGLKPLGTGLFSANALGDLAIQKLDNETLLSVIRKLTVFENEQKQPVRVNYSDLDVEEFGSVYEGLLEYDARFTEISGMPRFGFVEGKGRSNTGSHYTPEELVKPLIKHSLDYLIEDRLREPEKFVAPQAPAHSSPARLPGGEGELRKKPIPEQILKFARELRKNQTPAEEMLWQILRNRQFLDLKFRRQHPAGKYILDFYCHEIKLGIELDGSVHLNPDQKIKDKEKETWLKGEGIEVLRFWNSEVTDQIETVLEKISSFKDNLNPITPASPPSPSGRRVGDEGEKLLLQESALLNLKVADVACGSGHILLSAARRIAFELACVRETAASGGKNKVEQPAPEYVRKALRDVIKNCIYGVDKNPLAVELCKVALWLEAHNPGEPLNFLDHHIKCGDAIVGLAHKDELLKGIADEAFKALPGDDKPIASAFARNNKSERSQRGQTNLFEQSLDTRMDDVFEAYEKWRALPETTPEEIETKERAYSKLQHSGTLDRLKTIADIQVGQFFIPKTEANRDKLVTDAYYFRYLSGEKPIPQAVLGGLTGLWNKRFFHWFLEFPEVFALISPDHSPNDNLQGGFDCVLGNPPYLLGKKISGAFGDSYLSWVKTNTEPAEGSVDFVTYFLRRAALIINPGAFFALITAKVVAQGDSRISGLEFLINSGSQINFAVKSMKWPGKAAVEVSLISIKKEKGIVGCYLGTKYVDSISSYLDSDTSFLEPFSLAINAKKSFQGSVILGQGFVLAIEQVERFKNFAENKKVIFPYLNGDDLNSSINQKASREIINFFDYDKDYCHRNFPELFRIVESTVKLQREIVKRAAYRNKWWQYAEKGVELYQAIKNLDRVLVLSQNTKPVSFAFVPNQQVFDSKLVVFAHRESYYLALLQSSIHNVWAWKRGTTLGAGTLTYTPTSVYQTFPFPFLSNNFTKVLDEIGEIYQEYRLALMLKIQLGLTKTYNLFHSKPLRAISETEASLEDKAFEKLLGKDAAHLRKHLAKTPGTISFNEAVEGIEKLRKLHVQMDHAVLEAYGWGKPSASGSESGGLPPIELRHDFYEVDYLPENDRVRFTIHPDARKEVLKRLLALNHQYFEEEAAQGLHKEDVVRKFYEQKGVPVPEEVAKWFMKGKAGKVGRKPKPVSDDLTLFGEEGAG